MSDLKEIWEQVQREQRTSKNIVDALRTSARFLRECADNPDLAEGPSVASYLERTAIEVEDGHLHIPLVSNT